MKLCKKCKNEISVERLEIIPEAVECGSCITSREKKEESSGYVPPVFTEANSVYADEAINEKSFKLNSKIQRSAKKKKYTQLPGLSKAQKGKLKYRALINVVFNKNKTYHYSLKKFCDTFKVNTADAVAAANAGYTFHNDYGVLSMVKGTKTIIIGSVKNRQSKFE